MYGQPGTVVASDGFGDTTVVQRDGWGDTRVTQTDAFGDRRVTQTDAFGGAQRTRGVGSWRVRGGALLTVCLSYYA